MIRTVEGELAGDVPPKQGNSFQGEDTRCFPHNMPPLCREMPGTLPSKENPFVRVHDESYRSFFLADPVTDAEIAATCAIIYDRMDSILCQLERGGVEAYEEYLQDLQSQSSDKNEKSRSAAAQELEDTTVRGSPRDYQTALLEIAKTRNTIIHLGTGKGKTLIALLCIRHFATPHGNVDQPKQTLFLVPSVALAVQQSTALRANLPYSVATACWNVAHQSRLLLRRANILVATHGAIYDLMMHYGDLFSFRNFNLVVLDECHYAIGNHQYKIIMDKWYHTLPQDQRPHILGLTASPLTNVKHTHTDDQLSRMLASLEQTLDSKLVTWNDTAGEHAQDAIESQVVYKAASETPRDFPSHASLDLHKCRPRELQQLVVLYEDLGPLPVALYVQSVIKEISCNVYEKETTQQFDCLLNHLQAVVHFCQKQGNQPAWYAGCSDKLLKLEALLKEQLKCREDAVGLVFVQRRITAMALHNYFRREVVVDADCDTHKLASLSSSEKAATIDQDADEDVVDPPVVNQVVEENDGPDAVDFESTTLRSSMVSSFCDTCEGAELSDLINESTFKAPDNDDYDRFADADELNNAYTFESVHLRTVQSRCIEAQFHEVTCTGVVTPTTACWIPDQFCDAVEEELPVTHATFISAPTDAIFISDQFCDAVEEESPPTKDNIVSDQFCDADEGELLPTKVICMSGQYSEAAEEEELHVAEMCHIPGQFCDAVNEEDVAVEVDDLHPIAGCCFQGQSVQAVEEEESHPIYQSEIPGEACDFLDLNAFPAPPRSIRCGVLVRRATQIFKYLNAANHVALGDGTAADYDPEKVWLHQIMQIRGTLSSLRKKEINVLVATSIVEEGVDVQACSFVAVFDTANSVKAYIQMKGRARQKDAKFFLFSDKSSESLCELQLSQQRIEAFIKQQQDEEAFNIPIPMQCALQGPIFSMSAEQRAVAEGQYRAPHGTVDLKSAKALLNRYILNIPVEAMARATKDSFLLHLPKFGEQELILPAHLPLSVRVVAVPQAYREMKKRTKHQIMALMACVRLHKLKLLNERLLPLGKQDLTQELLRVGKNQTKETSPYAASINSLFAAGRMSVFLYTIIQTGDAITKVNHIIKGGSKRLVLICTERISVELELVTHHHRQLGDIECKLDDEIETTFDELQWEISVKFFSIVLESRWRKKTRGQRFLGREKAERQEVIAPMTIGLLTAESELDWKGMEKVVQDSNRSPEERESACLLYDKNLPSPRMCNPTFHEFSTYIVMGPTSLDCSAPFSAWRAGGGNTFRDHYEETHGRDVPSNATLFLAHRLWYQPSAYRRCDPTPCDTLPGRDFPLPEGIADGIDMCAGLATILLPRSTFREARLADPSLSLLSIVLPQLLYNLERQLLVDSFLRFCLLNFPVLGACIEKLPWAAISVALTAKSANLDEDYERYEWLGDGVLKLLQSDALLCTPELRCWVKHLHEGELSILRSAMGNNEYLAAACKRIGFEKYLLTTPLARGQWVPRHLDAYWDDNVKTRQTRSEVAKLSTKVCADVMESILGLIFMHFGYDSAMSVGRECGVLLPKSSGINLDHWVRPFFVPRANAYDAATLATGRAQFSCPALVEEAFTHPSAVHEAVPSYQKLEWIGDAVLCVAIREWIFRTFPLLPVGDMAIVDAAVVSNEVLGYQCFKTGLQRFINHRDQTIPSRLEYYEWSINEGGRALWGSDPPKMLPDVVEALLGAAHLDGGYAAGQLAVRTILGPILDAIESFDGDASKLSHPISKLNRMAGHLVQVYVQREDAFLNKNGRDELLWEGNGWRRGSIDGNEFTAAVNAMGRNIISVVDPSLKVARNRACSLVVAVLEKHPELERRWKKITAAIDRKCSEGHPYSVGAVDFKP